MASLNIYDVDSSSQSTDSFAKTSQSNQGCRRYVVWRYVIAFFGFWAMTTSYSMRSHMSVTLVGMVGTSNVTNATDKCGEVQNVTIGEPGEFDWDQKMQGIVNSAFYYGYFIPQIAGGRLAEKHSAKWVVFLGGCLATVATFIGPVAAKIHVGFFIVTRILCGFGLAVFQPSLHLLIARWAPPNERSIFSAIIYSGNQFGVVISQPIAGILCDYASDGGWPWPFYTFGIIGAVWLCFWMIFVYNSPTDHPWISAEEHNYISSRLDNHHKQALPVPWKKIFKSKSVWGLILCHFGYNWGFYTILTELPTYMSNVLGFSLSKNGALSSLPYLLMMVVGYLSSFAAFHVIKRDLLPIVVVRKGLNTIAFYGCAISLLVVTFLTCQTMTIYGMLVLSVIFFGLTYAGFQINHVDISPNYAGTLQGITNTAACIPGIVSPYIVGVITNGNETQEAWSIVFYMCMAILLVMGTCYLILGSANLKSWNEPKFKTTLESNIRSASSLSGFDKAHEASEKR
ncbi:hypothetical protein CHUAL_001004 [Chamberlinius hualienensis]